MRTRKKGYAYYGFKQGEDRLLKKWCKRPDFAEKALLEECAKQANIYIYKSICRSILEGLSFEKIDGREYQTYHKGDFYAYQRKTLALFREALIKRNKYPFDIDE